jgi:hypothetical protein
MDNGGKVGKRARGGVGGQDQGSGPDPLSAGTCGRARVRKRMPALIEDERKWWKYPAYVAELELPKSRTGLLRHGSRRPWLLASLLSGFGGWARSLIPDP